MIPNPKEPREPGWCWYRRPDATEAASYLAMACDQSLDTSFPLQRVSPTLVDMNFHQNVKGPGMGERSSQRASPFSQERESRQGSWRQCLRQPYQSQPCRQFSATCERTNNAINGKEATETPGTHFRGFALEPGASISTTPPIYLSLRCTNCRTFLRRQHQNAYRDGCVPRRCCVLSLQSSSGKPG